MVGVLLQRAQLAVHQLRACQQRLLVGVIRVFTCLNSRVLSPGATKKIFVGGLHYETKDADFRKYFEQFGRVASAEVHN